MARSRDDGAGRVWVGTIGAGLIEIDVGTGEERRYGRNTPGVHLSDDKVMALLYDRGASLSYPARVRSSRWTFSRRDFDRGSRQPCREIRCAQPAPAA